MIKLSDSLLGDVRGSYVLHKICTLRKMCLFALVYPMLLSSPGFAVEYVDPNEVARRFRDADLVIMGNVVSCTTRTLKEGDSLGHDGWMYHHQTVVDIYRTEIHSLLKGHFSDSVIVVQSRPYSGGGTHRWKFDRVDEKGDSLGASEYSFWDGGGADRIHKLGKYIILIQKEDTAYVSMLSRSYTKDASDFYGELEAAELWFDLVYEGRFPTCGLCSCLKAADLLGNKEEQTVVECGGRLGIYQFTGADWDTLKELEFSGDDSTDQVAWSVGDLNDNGRDEVAVSVDRTIKLYEWVDNQVSEVTHRFPYLIDDILIGDANDDNSNELVLFCYQSPLRSEDTGCQYHLCIADLDSQHLHVSWTDKGRLGYIKSNVIPSDHLVCIADIENVGHNQLVVAEGQSDMSPTRYHLLSWDEDELKPVKSFIISKGTMVTEGHIEAPPWMIGDFHPIRMGGETVILASMVHSGAQFKEVVAKVERGNFTILSELPRPDDWISPNRLLCWIDIDGKGKGILGVARSGHGRNSYVFYRSSHR